MDYQPLLEHIRQEIEIYAHDGKQADYIPALANVNPDQFGLCLNILDGRTYRLGASDVKFSIQSISKVFSLAVALSLLGKDLWQRIGKEPSGTAFNSLVQLEYEHGKPRNPFINAGAWSLPTLSSRSSTTRRSSSSISCARWLTTLTSTTRRR